MTFKLRIDVIGCLFTKAIRPFWIIFLRPNFQNPQKLSQNMQNFRKMELKTYFFNEF